MNSSFLMLIVGFALIGILQGEASADEQSRFPACKKFTFRDQTAIRRLRESLVMNLPSEHPLRKAMEKTLSCTLETPEAAFWSWNTIPQEEKDKLAEMSKKVIDKRAIRVGKNAEVLQSLSQCFQQSPSKAKSEGESSEDLPPAEYCTGLPKTKTEIQKKLSEHGAELAAILALTNDFMPGNGAFGLMLGARNKEELEKVLDQYPEKFINTNLKMFTTIVDHPFQSLPKNNPVGDRKLSAAELARAKKVMLALLDGINQKWNAKKRDEQVQHDLEGSAVKTPELMGSQYSTETKQSFFTSYLRRFAKEMREAYVYKMMDPNGVPIFNHLDKAAVVKEGIPLWTDKQISEAALKVKGDLDEEIRIGEEAKTRDVLIEDRWWGQAFFLSIHHALGFNDLRSLISYWSESDDNINDVLNEEKDPEKLKELCRLAQTVEPFLFKRSLQNLPYVAPVMVVTGMGAGAAVGATFGEALAAGGMTAAEVSAASMMIGGAGVGVGYAAADLWMAQGEATEAGRLASLSTGLFPEKELALVDRKYVEEKAKAIENALVMNAAMPVAMGAVTPVIAKAFAYAAKAVTPAAKEAAARALIRVDQMMRKIDTKVSDDYINDVFKKIDVRKALAENQLVDDVRTPEQLQKQVTDVINIATVQRSIKKKFGNYYVELGEEDQFKVTSLIAEKLEQGASPRDIEQALKEARVQCM